MRTFKVSKPTSVYAFTKFLLAFGMILTTSIAQESKPVSDPLTKPKPRNPEARSFDSLASTAIALGRHHYVDFLKTQPRHGAEDYSLDPPAVPPLKTNDAAFYKWLLKQKLPREFAEMLYTGAPEVSFMEGSGYLNGVDALIEENSDRHLKNIREAGFFIVGSGPNGDALVVDVGFTGNGAVAFLPIELYHDKTSKELREMFIPIAESIGEYIRIHNSDKRLDVPADYWAAKKRKESTQPSGK